MSVIINGDTGIDKITDGSVVTADFASGAITGNILPTGSILQVVSTTKTDTFSTSTTGYTDITGLSVSITPTSASSKILVMWNVQFGHAVTTSSVVLRIMRDSTPISIGDQVGTNRLRGTSPMFTLHSNTNNTTSVQAGTYLDSPSTTSSITYKAQGSITGSTYYINRTGEYNDGNYESTGTSTITVMEIAG